jgi:hypothetical protein
MDKLTWLLEFAYQSYYSLNRYIAHNEALRYFHGDIKPENMIVLWQPANPQASLSVKFIDFDEDKATPLYYPLMYVFDRPTPSKKMDCYCLIRVLVSAFGDAHPVWKSESIDDFVEHHSRGAGALLEFLFEKFDRYFESNFMSKETAMALKTIFMKLHYHEDPHYPSAAKITNEFKAIYEQHCEWLNSLRAPFSYARV